jgi:hypothetical protein
MKGGRRIFMEWLFQPAEHHPFAFMAGTLWLLFPGVFGIFIQAINRGWYRERGGRIIHRSEHPALFRFHVNTGLAFASLLAVGAIVLTVLAFIKG